MHVRNLMTTNVATVPSSASLKEAARIMIDRGVSGLPVVDDDGVVVGIVTEGDILHQESLRNPAMTLRSLFKANEDPALSVVEAMTGEVHTISVDADHTEAARVMESGKVKRLPVIDGDRRVVGILSRADVLRVFARSDEEIASEIRTDVIERVLWLDPSTIDVHVEDGMVALAGRVPAKSDARILEEMARRVDGAIEVDSSRLDFDVDDTKRAEGPLAGGLPRSNW